MRLLPVIVLAVVTTCCGTVSPAARTPQPTEPWLSPRLHATRSTLASALEAPFDSAIPVVQAQTGRSGAMAKCGDYFHLRQAGYAPVSDQDYDLMRLDGVRCHALQSAARMRPGLGHADSLLRARSDALSLLPPSVGPSPSPEVAKLRLASAQAGHSWRAYAMSATSDVKDGVITVHEPGFVSELMPLAVGDINNDGQGDLLLQVVGYGEEGTWRDIRLLVLTQDSAGHYRIAETVVP